MKGKEGVDSASTSVFFSSCQCIGPRAGPELEPSAIAGYAHGNTRENNLQITCAMHISTRPCLKCQVSSSIFYFFFGGGQPFLEDLHVISSLLFPLSTFFFYKNKVRIGGFARGSCGFPAFPEWLGKNSSRNKKRRLLGELAMHLGDAVSGGQESIRLSYATALRDSLLKVACLASLIIIFILFSCSYRIITTSIAFP